jgi:hypothetical protein
MGERAKPSDNGGEAVAEAYQKGNPQAVRQLKKSEGTGGGTDFSSNFWDTIGRTDEPTNWTSAIQ